ncbi:MAG: glycosyltransferase family 2 protein [Flavobacteriales bacterium]|nr:glycosyltransferase family 2 protein [Flavobacteriales bacterium]HQW40587.1 glycosyltransferase family 2 protein [Flavobacteriales bacterium]
MTGISAVIITRNEAHNIVHCLVPLKGLVDEVIVVDAQSTDGTRELAKQHGATVVERAWTDYSDQKNFANDQATGPYILSLDADEVLSPELIVSIRKRITAGLNGAYRLNRLTNYCGHWIHHSGWYPDAKVRLFPKQGTRWEGAHVHEELQLAQGTKITPLEGDLLHYSYTSVADHLQRLERYSDLHAQKMNAAGKRGGLVKRYLSPVVKFIQTFFFQLGFLDGAAGWRIAWYSAYGVYLKYAKLQRLRNVE